MMKLFAVRDVKSESYGAPLSIVNTAMALRGFTDACCAPGSELAKYPNDYMLYELGTWEPNSGEIVGHKHPIFVKSASEAIAAAKSALEATKASPVEGELV